MPLLRSSSRAVSNARLKPRATRASRYLQPRSSDAAGSYSLSTWWTKATAIDPSPTADATRLMLPPRTSPTANTPGRLVSSRCGGRASGHLRRRQVVGRQIRSGLDEALAIERDAAVQPAPCSARRRS